MIHRLRKLSVHLFITLVVGAVLVQPGTPVSLAEGPLDFQRLAGVQQVRSLKISPNGETIAYTVSVPRQPGVDDDGPAWTELRVVNADGSRHRTFVGDHHAVSQLAFTPDGTSLTFVSKRDGDEHSVVWSIPLDGGEATRRLEFESSIDAYAIAPDGTSIAFVATPKTPSERKSASKKGYDRDVFEEEWRHRNLYIASWTDASSPADDPSAEPVEDEEPLRIPVDGSAFDVAWSADSGTLLTTVAPRPLIDDRYMMRRITLISVADRAVKHVIDNPGKLGVYRISPDGKHVAMVSAADPNDPSAGRLLVAGSGGGELRDLMPEFEGHVRSVEWQGSESLLFIADRGCETRFGRVDLKGNVTVRFESSGAGSSVPVVTSFSVSRDGKTAAFVGQKPTHPAEVYVLVAEESTPRRLTESNPWMRNVDLAPQEVITWTARDGLQLEGMLIRPLDGKLPAPLILMVHGGPESNDRNGWLTAYSRPGQLAAAAGFAVLYPNYRGSTGRGVAFSKHGHGDAAGKEFDDLIDAIDHLVAEGIVDADRVGVTGGSYGGYATGWLSTRYSERIRGGVMFVGISNKLSKGFTTDIPIEDQMSHTLFEPWTRWQYGLERSPLFHAEKSRTPLLIAGGTADTRVHPSQSLQLYRALKMMGNAPVRYVRYPGEPHGNRRAASRDDYVRRVMRWMIHFVRDGGTELPPQEVPYDFPADESSDEDNQ